MSADQRPERDADARADRLLAAVDLVAPALDASQLDEVELEVGDVRVRLARTRAPAPIAGSAPAAPPPAPAEPTAQPDPSTGFPEPEPGMRHVVAPLTGVWYASPSPGARAYVSEGQEITAGQVVGLIEAMKLFNEIKSDVSGTVSRLLVENGTLVKRRQPLLEVSPA
jgi:acetyl-CoA carboxylase biotin carboxyl carrier protein